MKKFSLILIVMISCIFIFSGINASASGEENVIDIYLIAGQSNAVGNTDANIDELRKIDTRYETGFEDILYYGYTDVEVGGSAPKDLALVSTKLGLGLRSNNAVYMGPEVGMAEYLSNNYENQKFGIIKYASGSSSIYDDIESQNNSRKGNWYSPGVAKAMGVAPKSETISGNCYKVFLEVVKAGLEAYKQQGYTPKIKGLAWIQGESESGSEIYSAKYSFLLQALIGDMRTDLSKITNEDLSELHVVISKIPLSYEQFAKYTSVVRSQQDLVANNDAFATVLDNNFTLPGALNGTDNNHYSWSDMLYLGRNIMEEFFTADIGVYNSVKFKCSEGGISQLSSASVKADEIVTTTLTPNFGYELTDESIIFKTKDGKVLNDVVYALKGNFLQIKMPNESFVVEINFYKIPQFEININSSNGIVYRTNSLRNPFRDENISFTFVPDNGYELVYLSINGEMIDLNKLDSSNEYLSYTLTVNEDLEVFVVFDKVGQENKEENPEHEIISPTTGCKGSLYASISGLILLVIGVVILKIKKGKEE